MPSLILLLNPAMRTLSFFATGRRREAFMSENDALAANNTYKNPYFTLSELLKVVQISFKISQRISEMFKYNETILKHSIINILFKYSQEIVITYSLKRIAVK